jgi:AcrR family transcriptional regulator
MALDRQAIIRQAATLVDREGIDQLTLARVAAEIGLRPSSLYNHLEGLDQLRREVALFGLRQLSNQLARAAIGKAADEAVLAIADAYRCFAKEHPGLYAATLRGPDPSDPEWQAAWREMVEIILTVLRPYGLSEANAVHALRSLRSLVHGFTTLELAGAFVLPLDLDESFQQMVQTFIAGLDTLGSLLCRVR